MIDRIRRMLQDADFSRVHLFTGKALSHYALGQPMPWWLVAGRRPWTNLTVNGPTTSRYRCKGPSCPQYKPSFTGTRVLWLSSPTHWREAYLFFCSASISLQTIQTWNLYECVNFLIQLYLPNNKGLNLQHYMCVISPPPFRRHSSFSLTLLWFILPIRLHPS